MKKKYQWIICAAGLVIHFCNCGLVTTSFGIFMPLIREGIGLGDIQLSVMMTLRSLVALIATILAGNYYKRIPFRLALFLISLFVPAGMFLLSVAKSAAVCYIAIGLMGAAFGIGAVIPVAQLMHNWFGEKSSSAIAVCATGSSLSAILVPPVVTVVCDSLGLTAAFRVLVVFTLTCTVFVLLVVKERPEEKPVYAESRGQIKGVRGRSAFRMSSADWRWLMVICFLLGGSGTISNSNMSVHMVTEGFTTAQAAQAMSLFGACLLMAKLLFSLLSGRVGTDRMSYLLLGAITVSCFLYVAADPPAVGLLMLSSVLYGLGSCPGAVGTACWTGDFAEEEEYADRLRNNQTFFFVGALLMTPFPGVIAECTGSYDSMFFWCGVMGVAMIGILWKLYSKRRKFISRITDIMAEQKHRQ